MKKKKKLLLLLEIYKYVPDIPPPSIEFNINDYSSIYGKLEEFKCYY